MDRQHGRLAGHHDRLQAGRRVLAGAKAEERGGQVARGQPAEQRVGLILRERQLDVADNTLDLAIYEWDRGWAIPRNIQPQPLVTGIGRRESTAAPQPVR